MNNLGDAKSCLKSVTPEATGSVATAAVANTSEDASTATKDKSSRNKDTKTLGEKKQASKSPVGSEDCVAADTKDASQVSTAAGENSNSTKSPHQSQTIQENISSENPQHESENGLVNDIKSAKISALPVRPLMLQNVEVRLARLKHAQIRDIQETTVSDNTRDTKPDDEIKILFTV